MFIKQQNYAITQQVNNEVKSQPNQIQNNNEVSNELIAELSHEPTKMDFGTKITASTENTRAEALEAFNRSEDRERKKHQ